MAKKDKIMLREMGTKLRHFRDKLALAINSEAITQPVFGQMYGYSARQLTSYEKGHVDPPASLLYVLWREGHSIDAIFSEGPISERGKETARKLYENAPLVTLMGMDESAMDRSLLAATERTRGVSSDKIGQNGPAKDNPQKTSSKRAARHSAQRTIKKRLGK